MRQVVPAPGFENGRLEVEWGGLGSAKIWLDGQPAPAGSKKGEFRLKRNDDREVTARWKTAFPDTAPILVIDETPFRMSPPLQWFEWIWAGCPMLLMFIGGAIGGGLGGLAMTINLQIFRTQSNVFARYALSGLVSVVAIGGWLIAALMIHR